MAKDRRSKLTLQVLAVALVLGTIPAWAGFDEQRSFTADTLTVRNLIGAVKITGHSGPAFQVMVHVQGKDGTRESIRLEAHEGSSATLEVVFPLHDQRNYVYPALGAGSSSSFNWNPEGSSKGLVSSLLSALGSDQVKVRGSGSGFEIWADVEIQVPRGKTLRVDNGVGKLSVKEVQGDVSVSTHSGEVDANGVRGGLVVDTGSGNVAVEAVDGNASVDTGSGDVRLARCGGDVSIDTGSGNVELDTVHGARLAVDTGSGNVRATALAADSVSIDTGSGDVRLAFERMGSGSFDIDTGSGAIRLALPTDASADIQAETGSGGIDIDLGPAAQVQRHDRDQASVRVGGGAARVVLETGSGGIEIAQAGSKKVY
ncbi:MAG TPA: DUF4097 family beta strand repeat-containing protein [Candidatus Polarisedimenticolaceae bacterium]|nr:DUF4097 family beta strand repeat-containing protein [Candidatus Polarisedimenticolaceae bacterium]